MAQRQPAADLILHGGKILTLDPHDSLAEAVAISGLTIQAVGSDQEILPLAGPGTLAVNLQRRTLVPGIIDIHAHMDREGLREVFPSLAGARSISEVLDIIQGQVAQKKPGEWVVTMPVGEPPNYAEGASYLEEARYPTRWELDSVSPENPVYIKGIWIPWNVPPAVSVANSAALGLAGIDRGTTSPDSSITIEQDPAGEPTGVFVDSGRYPAVEFTLLRQVPRFTHQQRVTALQESMRLYNSVGTTSIYEGHGVAPEVLQVYKTVWDAGEMTVRSNLTLSPSWKSTAQGAKEMEQWGHSASGQGFGDAMLRVGGYFIQYRGSRFLSKVRSAELPYTGWAGFAESYNSPARFKQLVRLAAQNNLRVNSLVRESLEPVLRVFEEINREIPIKGRRWTLVHVCQASADQLRRIRDLGLLVETIPLTELWLRGNRYSGNPELADTAVAHRRYLEAGVDFAFGTDNKPYNPFATLWAAVARRERHTDRVMGPDQCLSRMEALRVFTLGGARYSFDESRLGSLEPGKLADLAVLSEDFLEMPEPELPNLRSVLTVVDGRIVHRSGEI